MENELTTSIRSEIVKRTEIKLNDSDLKDINTNNIRHAGYTIGSMLIFNKTETMPSSVYQVISSTEVTLKRYRENFEFDKFQEPIETVKIYQRDGMNLEDLAAEIKTELKNTLIEQGTREQYRIEEDLEHTGS